MVVCHCKTWPPELPVMPYCCIDWSIVCCLMPFSTLFKLYHSSQCTYHAFLEFFLPALCTIFFASQWLLSHTTILKQRTALREEEIQSQWLINPCKEYWLSQRSNQCYTGERERHKILDSSKWTLSQTMNFRLFHIERVCRQQFQVW